MDGLGVEGLGTRALGLTDQGRPNCIVATPELGAYCGVRNRGLTEQGLMGQGVID